MNVMTIPIYYKPHKAMNFRYGSAVALAQSYQAKHPEWLVCGSLALMLAGYMKVRRLSDIDFATRDYSSIPRFERFSKNPSTILYFLKLPNRFCHRQSLFFSIH